MTSPVLNVQDLSFAYGQNLVFEGVSFAVSSGELFVIIGPNGSGKTSLIKAVSGLEKPCRGRIEVFGQDIASYSRRGLARRVALVSQQTNVQSDFSIGESVLMGRYPYYGLVGREGREDREAAVKAMTVAGVEQLKDRKMSQLSGGERQRALIARALCQDPEIMLLDEPTSSLDLSHQQRIMDVLENLKKDRGITIIMVAHDLNLASLYGDRLLLLNKGRVATLGAPSDVLTYENLEDAFQCVLLVDQSPLDGQPRVTVTPGRYLDSRYRRAEEV